MHHITSSRFQAGWIYVYLLPIDIHVVGHIVYSNIRHIVENNLIILIQFNS